MRKAIVGLAAVVLLTLTISTVLFPIVKSENSSSISASTSQVPASWPAPVELQTNITGEAGYSVFQVSDGSLILNTANQTCTFLVKLDPSYHLAWTKPIQIDQNKTILPRLLPTSDGGYVLAGIVDNQYALVKTDAQGNIQWTKMLSSGAPINYFMSIIQTQDGGFALAGFGEKVEEGLGWIWFAKTDSSGNMSWNETLSGPLADCPSTVFQTSDGGYVMSCVSYSFEPNQAFFSIIKMDTRGNVLENKSYGGEGYYFQPECNYAINTTDGGYLMAGYLWQKSAWILKIDSEGNMQWNQTYGSNRCSITDALETPNGYILIEISNLKDAGIIMTDKMGNQLWNMSLPGVTLPVGLEANFNSIISAKDGSYIMVGSKNNTVWLAKLGYNHTNVNFLTLSVADVAFIAAVAIIAAITTVYLKKKNWKAIGI